VIRTIESISGVTWNDFEDKDRAPPQSAKSGLTWNSLKSDFELLFNIGDEKFFASVF
jgi:hypothetical protein